MDGLFDFIGELIRAPFICAGWLIVGFIAGGMARYFMRSENVLFTSDIMLGFGGAVIGGFITSGLLGFDPNASGFELVIINLVIATITAMGLIYVGRRFFGNEPTKKKRRRR